MLLLAHCICLLFRRRSSTITVVYLNYFLRKNTVNNNTFLHYNTEIFFVSNEEVDLSQKKLSSGQEHHFILLFIHTRLQ
jgi:hypothetical protein